MNLALWLKSHGFKADQVQAFYPSPMANATTMYHSQRNPLNAISRKRGEEVITAKGLRSRRLHKAFLRYHDADNWPMIRDALKEMGRSDLIGNGKKHLVPRDQPRSWILEQTAKGRHIATQHNGLPRTPAERSRDRRKNAENANHQSERPRHGQARDSQKTTNNSTAGKRKTNARRDQKSAWSATAKGNIDNDSRGGRSKGSSGANSSRRKPSASRPTNNAKAKKR